MTIVNSDIYSINQYVEELEQKHMDGLEEDTLMMSTFGFLAEMFSENIQNSIIVASELGNEIFPIKAKFERNILTYAVTADIQNINATPAVMDVQIGINEDDLLNNMNNDIFILDSNTPIYIEDFQFHLDYNIRITRTTSVTTGENIYLAQYEMAIPNPLSDITKPYLLPPVRIFMDNYKFLFIYSSIRQVQFEEYYNKIISNDSIENKTFEFEYNAQLAYFDLSVVSGNATYTLDPIYDGSALEDETKKYCYYSYLSNNRIRVKFIKSSFEPSLNDEVTVRVKTTKGSSGNFKYTDDVIATPISNTYTYNNLSIVVRPLSNSEFGVDKKSIEDLKRIIPKETLSRGNITSNIDLQNYFNILDTANNRMVFQKKIDNQFERVYYSYLLLKDENGNVIPTNTTGLRIFESEFDEVNTNRLILKPGSKLVYDPAHGKCIKDLNSYTLDQINELEKSGFVYTNPFLIVINKSPLSLSYYLNIIDRKYYTTFSYINNSTVLQFISTSVNLKRQFLVDRNTYKLDILTVQNINEDRGLITYDPTGTLITDCKVRAFCVFYNSAGDPIRYKEASLLNYSDSNKTFNFRFTMNTDDVISSDSHIKILDLIDINTVDNVSYAYLPSNCKVSIYIVAQLDQEYGRSNLDSIIPGLTGYTLCNKYDIEEGIDFFINYSDIISSKIAIEKDLETDPLYHYTINSIPVVKYSYVQNENRIKYFIDSIIERKLYIDNALTVLEDSFGIDFKLFNTYGPSKVFKTGYNKETLNRTNLSLKFRMKFDISAEDNLKEFIIADIKTYIENINEIENFHISKLITYLTNTYTSIQYMEFLGINNYNTTYQYIIKDDSEEVFYVPEFLNISSTGINYSPDITIDII